MRTDAWLPAKRSQRVLPPPPGSRRGKFAGLVLLVWMGMTGSSCWSSNVGSKALGAEPPETPSFRRDIAPVLRDRCLACHGPQLAEGGYRVDSFARTQQPGDSELPPLAAGSPDTSELLRRVSSEDASERMPLDAPALSAESVEAIRRWIEAGAQFDGEDPEAPLATIIPAARHPAAPQHYARPMPITALAFAPDGQQLIAAGYHEVTVWTVTAGTLARRIGNLPQRIYSLEFSPDGKRLVVAGGEPGHAGEVRVLSWPEGALLSVVATGSDAVFAATVDSSGQRLAAGGADGQVQVFDLATAARLWVAAGHADWVLDVAWNPAGDRVASAGRDLIAKVYAADTGRSLAAFNDHEQPVTTVRFHPREAFAYSGDLGGRLYKWKLEDGKRVAQTDLSTAVLDLAVTSSHLWAASSDRILRRIELDNSLQIKPHSGLSEAAVSVAWHGAQYVAAGSQDGHVTVWDRETAEVALQFVAAPGENHTPP